MKSSYLPEASQDISFLKDAVPAESNPKLVERGDLYWCFNDSPLSDYNEARFSGYPGGLLQILETQIGRSHTNIGIDIAGGNQGRALRDLFDDGFLGRGLVTNYSDMRRERALADGALDHIEGDLATAAVWHKIIDWQRQQAPDGLALALHRPWGALQDQPLSVYVGAAHLLLNMLRPGGIFFSQVPRPLEVAPAGQAAYRELWSRPDISQILVSEDPGAYSGSPRFHTIIIKTP